MEALTHVSMNNCFCLSVPHSCFHAHSPPCSVGSNVQYDFELEAFQTWGASIFTFDPTLNEGDVQRMRSLPFLHFEPLGLTSTAEIEALGSDKPLGGRQYVNLMQMIAMTGRPFVDVVKIDCEGCEYAVLDELGALYSKTRLPPFRQLCVEFHT